MFNSDSDQRLEQVAQKGLDSPSYKHSKPNWTKLQAIILAVSALSRNIRIDGSSISATCHSLNKNAVKQLC